MKSFFKNRLFITLLGAFVAFCVTEGAAAQRPLDSEAGPITWDVFTGAGVTLAGEAAATPSSVGGQQGEAPIWADVESEMGSKAVTEELGRASGRMTPVEAPLSRSQHQIISFNPDQLTLPVLTKAFFEHPESLGDFMAPDASNKPSPERCGVSKEAFQAALRAYHGQFLQTIGSLEQSDWYQGAKIYFSQQTPQPFGSSTTRRYAQKINIDEGTYVCFMGDYHGSIHSFMRNLWRLVVQGHLNPDLTIKNPGKFKMIFLGDYVDRGRWGVEVLTTLITLKLKNWDNVFMVAGNHETGLLPLRDGFFEEILRKYSTGPLNIEMGADVDIDERMGLLAREILSNPEINNLCINVFHQFFDTLPVALFVACGENIVQCCHGGIEPKFNPGEEDEHGAESFFDSEETLYFVGPECECTGLFWSDFCQNDKDVCANPRGPNTGVRVGLAGVQAYLERNNLKAIFRAHQDLYGALFFSKDPNFSDPQIAQLRRSTYPWFGPSHWFNVVRNDFPDKQDCEFLLKDFTYPVFTFSSAVEPRMFPFDNFGLVNVFKDWGLWTLEICEYFLGRRRAEEPDWYNNCVSDRLNKHVIIGPNIQQTDLSQTERVMPGGPERDPIAVKWREGYDQNRFDAEMAVLIGFINLQREVEDVRGGMQAASVSPGEAPEL